MTAGPGGTETSVYMMLKKKRDATDKKIKEIVR